MSAEDKDALTWAGDENRLSGSNAESSAQSRPARPSKESLDPSEPAPMRSVALVGFGLFAGVYLLFTVAWLITAINNPREFTDILAQIMFQIGLWLAVAAPALWFGGVLFFVPRSSWLKSMLWLAMGALVLIPWPYILWAG